MNATTTRPAAASRAPRAGFIDLSRPAHAAASVVLASLLIAASAQVAIPMWPVPITMQTFAVLLIGATLGMRLGAASAALYALEGAAGLPVFANFAAGPAHLIGPTGGYIVGFVLAAAVVGRATDRGLNRSVRSALAPMTAGTLVLFAAGLTWLSLWAALSGSANEVVLGAGALPFVPWSVVKIVLAASLVAPARRLVRPST